MSPISGRTKNMNVTAKRINKRAVSDYPIRLEMIEGYCSECGLIVPLVSEDPLSKPAIAAPHRNENRELCPGAGTFVTHLYSTNNSRQSSKLLVKHERIETHPVHGLGDAEQERIEKWTTLAACIEGLGLIEKFELTAEVDRDKLDIEKVLGYDFYLYVNL